MALLGIILTKRGNY